MTINEAIKKFKSKRDLFGEGSNLDKAVQLGIEALEFKQELQEYMKRKRGLSWIWVANKLKSLLPSETIESK